MSESNEFVLGQGQGHQLEMAIKRNGGNTSDVQWLVAGNNFNAIKFLARGEAELIIKPKPPEKEEIPESAVKMWKLVGETNTQKQEGVFAPTPEYKFVVDYDLSFEELMERANCEINRHRREKIDCSSFPNTQTGKREVSFELISFPKYAVYEYHVVDQFAALKLRHTTLVEQLSFFAQLRKLHKNHAPIDVVSLASRKIVVETMEITKKRWFRKDKKIPYTTKKESCPSLYCCGMPTSKALLHFSTCGKEMNGRNGWKNHNLFLGAHL